MLTKTFPIKTLGVFLLLLSINLKSFAQSGNEIVGIPTTGALGVTVAISDLQRLSEEKDRLPKTIKLHRELEYHRTKQELSNAIKASSWPVKDNTNLNLINRTAATQAIHSNFLGVVLSEAGAVPPDSMGDIGSTQVCVVANGRIKFYNRNTVCGAAQTTVGTTSNTPLAAPVVDLDLDVFFSSVAGAFGVSDPHVRFDRVLQRWFIVAIDLRTAPNRCVIAVSSGATVAGAASFTFFFFVFDALLPVPPSPYAGGFFDYPSLGVDANALYIGGRMFNAAGTAYTGASVFVVRKSSILGAGPIVTTAFHQLGTASAGIYTPQGVDNDDPTATVGYIIGVDNAVFSQLDFHRITNPGGTPVASAMIPITAGITTSFPLSQVSSGAAQNMDANDDRLFAAMVRKNKITGASSLWTAHAIAVTSAGVAATSGAGRRNGTRWYELNNLGATPALVQSGTVFDNAAANPRGYWFPSIAASGQGHAVIGFSSASAINFADCGVAGRYRTDALGTTQAPVLATASSTSYNPAFDTGNPNRWGDYSQTGVDPLDDMTMWTFQEYANGTDSWGLRAIQLRAPPPASPTSPGALGCGSPSGANRSVSVTLNGTSVNNSEFYDPGTGYTNRLAVTTTGTGASITNLVFVNPTQITFNIVWPATLAGTLQTLTITNPDCQSVTTTYTLPNGCIFLPVLCLSFTGRDIGRGVQLNWVTDFETGNSRFDIERQNVRGEWVSIATQNTKGINGGTYIQIDDDPLPVNYYRLKQVDVDGKFSYSAIVKVEIKSSGSFVVYPNPVKDQLNVEFPESYRKGIVRLINSLGEIVYTARINSDNKHTIDVSNLSSGNYVVEIETETGSKKHSIVLVQRKEPKP